VRTARGWRIAGAGLTVTHQTGNRHLLAAAGTPATGGTGDRNLLPAGVPAGRPLEDPTAMTVPTDASEVLNVVHTYFAAADARDWDTYRALHADRVEVHFGGVNDDSEGSVAADRMLASARSLLDPVHLTQHMISTEVVRIDGDEATVTFYEEALHHHPPLGEDPARNTWVLHGRGEHRLRRTGDGWKLVAAVLVPVHETGNASLLADVAAAVR
jgi:SnoaL-like domain